MPLHLARALDPTPKKQQERAYFDAWLSHTKPAAWCVREASREAPDFLVDTPDGPIGVELTLIFKNAGTSGSPIKASEARHSRFLGDLAAEYYNRGGKPLYVKLALAKGGLPADRSRLVALLLSKRPKQPWRGAEFRDKKTGAKFYLRALPARAGNYSTWRCISDSIAWVRQLERDQIATQIQSKAAKLPAYHRAVDRVVLLLIVDRTRSSGALALPGALGQIDSCGFDEVHLLVHPECAYRIA